MSQVFPVECDDAGNAIAQTSEFYEDDTVASMKVTGVRGAFDDQGRRYYTGQIVDGLGRPQWEAIIIPKEDAAA